MRLRCEQQTLDAGAVRAAGSSFLSAISSLALRWALSVTLDWHCWIASLQWPHEECEIAIRKPRQTMFWLVTSCWAWAWESQGGLTVFFSSKLKTRAFCKCWCRKRIFESISACCVLWMRFIRVWCVVSKSRYAAFSHNPRCNWFLRLVYQLQWFASCENYSSEISYKSL